MPLFRTHASLVLLLATLAAGCERPAASTQAPNAPATPPVPAPVPTVADLTPAPTPARDSVDRSDSTRRDTLPKRAATAPRRSRFDLTAADSALWPVRGPAALPGSLLPTSRIIAYYGNPLSTRMGILGQIPPDEMMERLERTAAEWAAADPTTTVRPALHLIATVAQGKAGADGKYRLRMSDSLIERVAGWAERKGWLLFLDLQVGQSTVAAELPRLLPYLARPYVHLALDPEFAMQGSAKPGRKIGTLDAADVNHASRLLRNLVTAHGLPPKVLVVHRFTQRMLTNARQIELDPRVQVVIHMDGFGTPPHKRAAYYSFVVVEPVQFAGLKLFYKNDRPLMTPAQVLELWPKPVYVQYQ